MIIILYQRMLEAHQSPCSLLKNTQVDHASQLPSQLGEVTLPVPANVKWLKALYASPSLAY